MKIMQILFIFALIFMVLIKLNYYLSISIANKYRKIINVKKEYCEVDRIKIAYVKRGSGPPILLIHGFMASLTCFKEVIHHMERSYTVYAIDLIGFGDSEKSTSIEFTKRDMARVCKSFMDCQGEKKFIVLGHSMGGEVALNFAYMFPECIEKLILVDSSCFLKYRKVLPEWLEYNPFLCGIFLNNVFLTYFLMNRGYKFMLHDNKKYEKKEFVKLFYDAYKVTPKVLYKMNLEDDSTAISNKLDEIKNPVYIIWGNKDNIIPLEDGIRLHQQISDSAMYIIKECGHIPFIEKKHEFLNILDRILA